MKKAQSVIKSNVPAELQAAIERRRALVTQQEQQGNRDTYDHSELARLEAAAAEYQQNEVE